MRKSGQEGDIENSGRRDFVKQVAASAGGLGLAGLAAVGLNRADKNSARRQMKDQIEERMIDNIVKILGDEPQINNIRGLCERLENSQSRKKIRDKYGTNDDGYDLWLIKAIRYLDFIEQELQKFVIAMNKPFPPASEHFKVEAENLLKKIQSAKSDFNPR